MAIEFKKAKATRHPGVSRLPNGRLLARAAVRMPNGKIVTQRRLLPSDATEADAVQAVLQLKEAIRSPKSGEIPTPLPPATSQTVEAYSKSWLAVRTDGQKPSTAITYEACLSKHILPRVGHLTCDQVNRQAVQAWVKWAQSREMVREKKIVVDGEEKVITISEPYSQDSMRQWWRVAKMLFRDMAADHSLPDPTVRVEPPQRPELEPKREQRTLDLDTTGRLLEAARKHTADRYAEIAMLVLTGMRPGELYALKWECVDLAKGEVMVRRSVSKGVLTETTKTKARRVVPLHPHLVEELQAHRGRQLEEQDSRMLASGLVFPSSVGTPRTPNSLDKAFLKLCDVLNLDINLGSQVLRRSLNSNLVQAQVDRLVIRSIVGHTTEEMTARYFGARPEDKRAAVAILPIRRRSGDNTKNDSGAP